MSELLDAALVYASRGWPVIPQRAPSNAPLTEHGFHDASADTEVVRAWWAKHPNANIGIRTGVACDVLDVDHEDLVTGVADLPDCDTSGGPVARSGGDKWHLYFKPSGLGRRIRFSAHCDWLGDLGYVVAPPSTHRSGGVYRWFTPDDLPLTDAPAELVAFVRGPQRGKSSVATARSPRPRPSRGVGPAMSLGGSRTGAWNPAGIMGKMATAIEGERNETLVWAAHRIGFDVHRGKVKRRDADAACEQLHHVAVMVGLGEQEVERTIRSGYAAGLCGRPGKAGAA